MLTHLQRCSLLILLLGGWTACASPPKPAPDTAAIESGTKASEAAETAAQARLKRNEEPGGTVLYGESMPEGEESETVFDDEEPASPPAPRTPPEEEMAPDAPAEDADSADDSASDTTDDAPATDTSKDASPEKKSDRPKDAAPTSQAPADAQDDAE